MKKLTTLLLAACFSAVSLAKDIKTVTVTTTPQMHCSSCENKIKENLRFEKGVKAITTSVEKQTVVIKYDADKTNVEKLLKGFTKFGYTAKVVKDEPKASEPDNKK